MEKNNEVIQTHPLVGWDISTVDSYDALMFVCTTRPQISPSRKGLKLVRRSG